MADLPDDLIDRLATAVLRTAYGELSHSPTERILRERVEKHVPLILAALAEWADGALLDPDGWRRLDAKVAHRWHHAYGPDGAVLCNHPDTDFCSDPDRGEWTDYLHALTERETTP